MQNEDLIKILPEKPGKTSHIPLEHSQKLLSELSEEEKVEEIARHFSQIMKILGLDLNHGSLKKTPKRIAKMYVKELFQGLDPDNFPKITYFPHTTSQRAQEVITIQKIKVHSMCEHHFIPFFGTATVKYIPKGKILGLSKINRVVDYFCRRPQLQERLTRQIADSLSLLLETEDISVAIAAKHFCVLLRGVQDVESETVTKLDLGKFQNI